ncbi:unnamed protein product, partial [Mesorhabditis belari]|uniref:Transcription initiation factor IIF subunit alpha n=1 Tax=Mesorhabditis belari TaxID=2138241 RepID=A0AAF3F1I2_9BILA
MSNPGTLEYAVKVPKMNTNKHHTILKFNSNLQVDTSSWGNAQVSLEREDNRSTVLVNAPTQDYGEGTEYGRAAREEARRKKYGRQSRSYKLDNQPWKLSVMEEGKKLRRFRSMREGGAGEHADYWVFLKNDNDFLAYKVEAWHQFLPSITHKVLDIDQAEELFQQRAKHLNQFALKAQILKTIDQEDGEQLEKTSRLKIKDNFSDTDASDDDEDEEEGESSRDVAKYESEDGEEDGQEVDYMSDSGSDTEDPTDEKLDKELVGVGEEDGLRKLGDSDDDEDEEEEEENERNKKETLRGKKADGEENDSSDSEDDEDQEKTASVMLLPKKAAKADHVAAKKRAIEDAVAGVEAKKAKLDPDSGSKDSPTKSASSIDDILNEETVTRYLQRNPHTTKDLVSKFKSKCGNIDKNEIVPRLAKILKNLNPQRFRQKHGNKETLYFTMQKRN